MKNVLSKITHVLRLIFGYGIMICLFSGALVFVGYVVALIIGGPTAAAICEWIYRTFLPIIIYLSTSCVLLGLLIMYLSGEFALTIHKK